MPKPPLLILPDGNAINPLDVTRIFADPAKPGAFSSIILPDRLFIESGYSDHRAIQNFAFASWDGAVAQRDRLIAEVQAARKQEVAADAMTTERNTSEILLVSLNTMHHRNTDL